jgi:hypothetical protein
MTFSNQIRLLLLFGFIAINMSAMSTQADDKNTKPSAKIAQAPAAKAAPAIKAGPGIAPGVGAKSAIPGANAAPNVHANSHVEAGRHEPGMEHHEAGMERHGAMREHYEFHGRDVHHFDHAELGRWRGGRWNNSCYTGRCGWWWFSSGQWYFYEKPIYPYPLAVSEVVFLEPVEAVAVAPVTVAPVMQAPPPPVPAAPQFWYYCDNPAGYYPSVPTCSSGFREVAAPRR